MGRSASETGSPSSVVVGYLQSVGERKLVTSYRFKSCWVHVKPDEKWIGTYFPDGSIAHARPTFRDVDFARAKALGYPQGFDGVWLMNVEHELFHTALAELAGEPRSEVLWAAAHGVALSIDLEVAWTEECRVLAAQKDKTPELLAYVEQAKQP